jgi:hypothetical protein
MFQTQTEDLNTMHISGNVLIFAQWTYFEKIGKLRFETDVKKSFNEPIQTKAQLTAPSTDLNAKFPVRKFCDNTRRRRTEKYVLLIMR